MGCWAQIEDYQKNCCRCDRYIDDWRSCYTCGQKFCFRCINTGDIEKTTHVVDSREYCYQHLPMSKEEKAEYRADFFSKQ